MKKNLVDINILKYKLSELNKHLEVLDTKLSNLESISDHAFFEIYLLTCKLDNRLQEAPLVLV